MKMTRKQAAIEADRDRLYNVCCICLKYNSLRADKIGGGDRDGSAKPNEDSAFSQLVDWMGYKHADAVARFARTLP